MILVAGFFLYQRVSVLQGDLSENALLNHGPDWGCLEPQSSGKQRPKRRRWEGGGARGGGGGGIYHVT